MLFLIFEWNSINVVGIRNSVRMMMMINSFEIQNCCWLKTQTFTANIDEWTDELIFDSLTGRWRKLFKLVSHFHIGCFFSYQWHIQKVYLIHNQFHGIYKRNWITWCMVWHTVSSIWCTAQCINKDNCFKMKATCFWNEKIEFCCCWLFQLQ